MRSNKEIFRWDVWNNNTIEVVDASMATRGLDRHFHDSWTFGHITQGQCQFESGGFKHLAPEGSLFIIPPLEVHTSSADDANVKYRVVYIQDAIVNTLAPPLHTFMMSHYQRVWVNSGSMIQKLCDTLENGAELNSTWTDNLHRIISSTANPKRRYAPSELQEIINQSWDKNLGITALESFIGRSRWQTIRNFKKTIGMTPSSYLRQLRILKSRYMLANGNSLAETAYTLSFSDQSHYARSFKQVFGVSPDKLRKKIVLKNNEEF